MNIHFTEEVIVRPIDGMQLSEGYIREDSTGYYGWLPGMAPVLGHTCEEARESLEQEAKAYYGDDVVVDMVSHKATV